MSSIKKYGAFVFVLLLVVHCVFIYLQLDELRTISKVLLLPVLIILLASKRNKGEEQPGVVVYCGLVFSFLGDLLLTRSGNIFFLLGMLAFIGTHVCNGIFFFRLQKNHPQKAKTIWIPATLLAIVSLSVFVLLEPYLDSFKIPILCYMCIISVMAVLAAGTVNNPSVKKIAAGCFIPGAFLFVVSDALLAMNKFLWHQPVIDIPVMLTYGAAQYFLVMGFSEMRVGR